MPNPATFPALVIPGEYTNVEHDDGERFGELSEGVTFEHVRVALDNGYVVSIARTNLEGGEPSVGYTEGLWEAAVVRPATNPLFQMMGFPYEPATELDELNTHEPEEGIRVVGNLDNEGIAALLATVAGKPTYVPEATEPFDFEALFEAAWDEEVEEL